MRKTRTGSRLGRLALFAAALAVSASGAGKRAKTPPAYALVAGTVFHENGMSFAGAEVTLSAEGDSAEARRFRRIQVTASPRGEFAIRVPAAPMHYVLTASAPGYQPQRKPAVVSAEERVDVFFQLEPASDKKK